MRTVNCTLNVCLLFLVILDFFSNLNTSSTLQYDSFSAPFIVLCTSHSHTPQAAVTISKQQRRETKGQTNSRRIQPPSSGLYGQDLRA
jgi:hypothetical protein